MFLTLAGSLIGGNLVGSLFFAVKSPPAAADLLPPGLMLVALGMSVYGYTLPFSAIDIVRWRSAVIALALTLGGLIAMSIAPSSRGTTG